MPFFVLLAWWINKPLHMLFGVYRDLCQEFPTKMGSCLDSYEVTVLIASAFLVNYVTSDGKTNWVCHTYTSHPPTS